MEKSLGGLLQSVSVSFSDTSGMHASTFQSLQIKDAKHFNLSTDQELKLDLVKWTMIGGCRHPQTTCRV